MTKEELIISIARVLGSLPVLRWAFGGAWLAILVDFSDLFMKNLLDLGGVGDYQAFDKWLDLVYMVTFLMAALHWQGLARNVAVGLFAYRIVGVGVFEVVASRGVLLFFPNVFEFWFLFVAGLHRFKPNYTLTPLRAALWVLPLLALKEFQEYALHWGKWLDQWRATDVVIIWWEWLTGWF
jgi:hypothetical protein